MIRRTLLALAITLFAFSLASGQQKTVWSADEQPIVDQIRSLRKLPDDVRSRTHQELALKIRALPASDHKVALANALAGLSTEGDLGQSMLQEVATTLTLALHERPQPAGKDGQPAYPYIELASLVRYEHVQAKLDDPQYAAAMRNLDAADRKIQQADFTLKDLQGHEWTLKDLRGKVVLVNFWATWCPPCVKEMPDLQALYDRYQNQGLVVLGISDEDLAKVQPFVTQRAVSYPVLLDTGHAVEYRFGIMGIPRTFVYGRDGKLAAQSIDMRTRHQFQKMLEQAGLK